MAHADGAPTHEPTAVRPAAAPAPEAAATLLSPPLAKAAGPVGAAPAPAAVPVPVNQVARALAWMQQSGTSEASLQLHPESLGQVGIRLRVSGGEVHARLWVSESASLQVIQDGRAHLEAALRDQGLQLGSFDLQHGHRPFQQAPSAPGAPAPEPPAPLAAGQEAPPERLPTLENPHQIELYA